MIKLVKNRLSRTIAREVSMVGPTPFIANHKTKMTLRPSKRGITFIVPFESEKVTIPVDYHHTKSANGSHTTLIANGKGEVRTVEHLLATLSGLGIDCLEIELEGSNQVPVCDSSAECFYNLIWNTGTVSFGGSGVIGKVTADIHYNYDGSTAVLRPAEGLGSLSALIQFKGLIGEQYFRVYGLRSHFHKEICWARSFIRRSCDENTWELCRKEVPALPEKREDSPVLIFDGPNWIVAPKVPDEPVRHKILDAMGDLYTLGFPLLADITLIRPGHDFNRRLVEHLATIPLVE